MCMLKLEVLGFSDLTDLNLKTQDIPYNTCWNNPSSCKHVIFLSQSFAGDGWPALMARSTSFRAFLIPCIPRRIETADLLASAKAYEESLLFS